MSRSFFLLFLVAGCSSDPLLSAGADLGPAPGPQGFVLDVTRLEIAEGSSGGFDVSLAADPGRSLAISIVSSDPVAAPVSPGSFIFTSAQTPLHVTLSPPVDDNDVSETATVTISAAGVPDANLAVTVDDSTVIVNDGWVSPFMQTASVILGEVVCYQAPVEAGTLDSFGIFTPVAAGDYRMALYSDDGGKPGALLAAMPVRKTLADGANDGSVGIGVALEAGNDWLCLRVEKTTDVGYAGGDQITPACVRAIDVSNLDDVWPTPFGIASCSSDGAYNLWITSHHQR